MAPTVLAYHHEQMRRRWSKLKRVAIVSLTVASGLLCAAWVLSYFWFIYIGVPLPGSWSHATISQVRGRFEINLIVDYYHRPALGFSVDSIAFLERALPPSTATDMTLRPPPFEFNHLVVNRGPNKRLEWYTLGVPHWLIALVLLTWPAFALVKSRLSRPADGVPCPGCGYDLRGTLHRDTCPECGQAVSPDSLAHIDPGARDLSGRV